MKIRFILLALLSKNKNAFDKKATDFGGLFYSCLLFYFSVLFSGIKCTNSDIVIPVAFKTLAKLYVDGHRG